MQDSHANQLSKWRPRRRVLGCVIVPLLLLAMPVGCAIYVKHAADNMPDVGPEADILAEGGSLQRDTVTPQLTILADDWTNTYGPVIFVTYNGRSANARGLRTNSR